MDFLYLGKSQSKILSIGQFVKTSAYYIYDKGTFKQVGWPRQPPSLQFDIKFGYKESKRYFLEESQSVK